MRLHFLFFASLLFIGFAYGQTNKYEELMSQDWSNLKKYRAANEKILKSGDYPEVVFMGNSITEGWVGSNPEFFQENNFVGRGIGGQTTPQMLIRMIPDVVDLRPKVVVILAGTNDVAGNTGYATVKMITDNLKAMAEIAKQNNIKVILSSILPVYDYPWRSGLEPVKIIAEINTWIKEYAHNNDLVYLNYFDAMANDVKGLKEEYSSDGVHPNKEGYHIMEPLVLKAIDRAFNR